MGAAGREEVCSAARRLRLLGLPSDALTRRQLPVMLTRRHKIIVGVGGVVLMPVALAAGIYAGAVWENYKRMRAPGEPAELRKEETRLVEERALLERRIGALEGKAAAAGRSPGAAGAGASDGGRAP